MSQEAPREHVEPTRESTPAEVASPPALEAPPRPAHLVALRAALGGGAGGALASTLCVAFVSIDRGSVPHDAGWAWLTIGLAASILCGLSLLAEDLARHVARLRALVVLGVAATTAAVIGAAVAWAVTLKSGRGPEAALSAQAELIDAVLEEPGKALAIALGAMAPPLCMATLRLVGARWYVQALGNALVSYGALVTVILALDGRLRGTGEAQVTLVGMAVVATLGMLGVDRALARSAARLASSG